jgi:signal transduction histidine kinase
VLRLLPRSLVGRVFALYSISLLAVLSAALSLFYLYQFNALEDIQIHAETTGAILVPSISDNAVIGDYGSIERTLERVTHGSTFAQAVFIDLKGSRVSSTRSDPPGTAPPYWLAEQVAQRLYEVNVPIAVGGRDYGVLRLNLDTERIAGQLWQQTRAAFILAGAGLLAGLLIIRVPLQHWLGNLGHIRSFEQELKSGTATARSVIAPDAPIEFRQTWEVLNQAAATLNAQKEEAGVTLAAIADGVLTLNADGRVVLANPAMRQITGLAEAELLGRAADETLPSVFPGPPPHAPWYGRRSSLVTADGHVRVVDTTLSAIGGPDGRPGGYVLACRDVTESSRLDERLRAELASRENALTALRAVLESLVPGRRSGSGRQSVDDLEVISWVIGDVVARLKERSEQLNAIFELSPDGFVSFDANHCVNYVSPAFSRLTGLSEAQVMGRHESNIGQIVNERCAASMPLPGLDAIRAAAAASSDARRTLIQLDQPTHRVLEVGLRQSQSDTISQVLSLRDITHETEVDRLKSEFLSTAAHELRTPMASIYGFLELMIHRNLSPERQKDVLQTVHRQAELMVVIINELLDLARIEARQGKDFVLERLDLRDVVGEAVSAFKPPHDRAEPVVAHHPAPAWVRADRTKVLQALGNVLSNAYKYSPGGGEVAVRLLPGSMEDGGARWGIAIQDHGIGMRPEQLARVSERFYRADASGSIPGTGLGMSIVKEIIHLLGGAMELASEPDRGTCVTLWLPQAGSPDMD